MAWPTGVLSIVLEDVDRRMLEVKALAERARTQLATDTQSTYIVDLFIRLRAARLEFADAAAVPGIADYARAQKNDPNLDAVTEFQSVMAAIDDITSWITGNFPKDGQGYLLAKQFTQDGTVDRSFAPGNTATLRTLLLVLQNAIG